MGPMTVNERTRSPASPGPHAARRCLMLLPRGFDAPPELLRGMERRGVELREVNDPASAMVALARERFLAMVLVEPATQAEAASLRQAVSRYHPRIRLWQYRADHEPRLTRYEQPPIERPEPTPEHSSGVESTLAPYRIGPVRGMNGEADATNREPGDPAEASGRETEAAIDGEAQERAEPAENGSDPMMLSAEELSMLLSGRKGPDREDS